MTIDIDNLAFAVASANVYLLCYCVTRSILRSSVSTQHQRACNLVALAAALPSAAKRKQRKGSVWHPLA